MGAPYTAGRPTGWRRRKIHYAAGYGKFTLCGENTILIARKDEEAWYDRFGLVNCEECLKHPKMPLIELGNIDL